MKCGRCNKEAKIEHVGLLDNTIIINFNEGLWKIIIKEKARKKLLREQCKLCTPCANEIQIMETL